MGQDLKTEESKHRLGCRSSLGEGDVGLITNKWPAELQLMMELIGALHNLDPGSKFNLQLFPGLLGKQFLPRQRASNSNSLIPSEKTGGGGGGRVGAAQDPGAIIPVSC